MGIILIFIYMVEKNLTTKETISVNLNYVHDDSNPQSCGYCKVESVKSQKSFKVGFDSPDINPIDYERLMYLGWRRCGTYYYKANLLKSCCQLHTIRLKVSDFKANKHQNKVLKRFSNFLKGELKNDDNNSLLEISISQDQSALTGLANLLKLITRWLNIGEVVTSTVLCSNDIDSLISNSVMFNKQKKCVSSNFFNSIFYKLNKEKSIDVFDKFLSSITNDGSTFSIKSLSTKLQNALKIAIEELKKLENLSLVSEYMGSREIFDQITSNLDINVELMFVNFTSNTLLSSSEVKPTKTEKSVNKQQSKEETKEINKEALKSYRMILDYPDSSSSYLQSKFNLYKKYQISVHKDNPEKIKMTSFNDSWNNNSFKLNDSCKVNFKDVTFDQEFNNLNLKILTKYGTINLLHYVDNELIAVSVIDLMPHSLSSVYCYYQPEYKKLSLGIYTALKEIEFISILNKYLSSSIDYYFMGFYVQTCQKMKYKAEYAPSQLLCPVTYSYTYLTNKVIDLIDKTKGSKLIENEKEEAIENEMINGFGLNSEEINVIYKLSKLIYNGAEYKISEFIEKYIRKDYKDNLISSVKALIQNVPKDLALKLKFMMG